MGRNLGPKHTLCRRVGEKICSSAKCPALRRGYPPGVHGPKGKRKLSEYATQLLEKQKAKRIYGLLERQFKKYYRESMKKKGDTSVYLFQMLERRLDNVLYRCGFAKTRAQARQMVLHGHVRVNDRKVDRPSYSVRVNDVVRVVSGSTNLEKRETPSWISVDEKATTGKVTQLPDVQKLSEPLRPRLIIEFYSR